MDTSLEAVGADIDAQRTYYDARWSAERFGGLRQLQRTVVILECLQLTRRRSPSILDLGCGTGWLTTILARFGPAVGIDLSPVAVAQARDRFPDVRFRASDFAAIEATEDPFDIVVSQEVVEHLEDQQAHVDLIARLLKPGGYLILTTPNGRYLSHWLEDRLDGSGRQPIERWLTVRELRALLTNRFRIVRLGTVCPGPTAVGISRILNSRKLAAILGRCGVAGAYQRLLGYCGLGLHSFVLAQRR